MRSTGAFHAVAGVLLLTTGCHAPSEGNSAPLVAAATAPVPRLDAGPITLTDETLKRFMAYQADFASASSELASAAQRLEGGRDGGLSQDPAALAEATRVVRRQAQARRDARQKSGLGEDQVAAIERMVSDVLGQRLYARSVDPAAMQRQLEEVVAKVPAEARGEFQQAIDQLRARSQASQALAAERSRYGDANVNLILAHEGELQKHWTAMAAGLAGSTEKESRP